MMNAQELTAWSHIPFSGPAERIAAYADPQYHHPLGDAYRQALIVKEALSMDPAQAQPTIERSLAVTMPLGEPGMTLEEEAASNPFAKASQINDSRLGLSGRDPDADAAAADAAAQAALETQAQQTDATARAAGDLRWNGRSFEPRR